MKAEKKIAAGKKERKQALNEDELLINDYLREFCRHTHSLQSRYIYRHDKGTEEHHDFMLHFQVYS